MRLLVDESCDFSLVRALRAAGHDTVAVAELTPRADDETVLNLAVQGERLLLTEDKDFGQLVYAGGLKSCGVMLLRFPARTREHVVQTVLNLIADRGNELRGRFVVVQPGRIRIGPESEGETES